eukprot:gnl/Spiro4/217_TR123_c0_g1_i1.p1 gnl/Spiro4/217_TR123_c0_g1~~gnl/Spiro4/217_TR123_c0_g1_i1.p1  ORF type:complete len:292 (+),score=4.22 gnl/Spiro4/217_TR123_c0_g1_i1:259-1134(+)
MTDKLIPQSEVDAMLAARTEEAAMKRCLSCAKGIPLTDKIWHENNWLCTALDIRALLTKSGAEVLAKRDAEMRVKIEEERLTRSGPRLIGHMTLDIKFASEDDTKKGLKLFAEMNAAIADREERIRVLEGPLKCGHPGACLTMGPVLQFDEIDALNVEKSTYCIVCHAQARIEQIRVLRAALQRIDEDSECECECNDENCCEAVGEWCPGCIARIAIRAIELGQRPAQAGGDVNKPSAPDLQARIERVKGLAEEMTLHARTCDTSKGALHFIDEWSYKIVAALDGEPKERE